MSRLVPNNTIPHQHHACDGYGGEGGDPEQSQVQERVGQPPPAAYEDGADQQARGQNADGRQGKAAHGEILDAVPDRQRSQQRQEHTDRVQSPGSRSASFGNQEGAGDQQQGHGRKGEQEHRAPPVVLQASS
ncbi:hypothetical protein [Nonomuraea candida]|uniref:hypothetical protein n=1 Tax=Nonomuraea candida TaxID=359159 RepID=UPI0012FC2699|nr:hypothetical protein [Nonomuraea candida]